MRSRVAMSVVLAAVAVILFAAQRDRRGFADDEVTTARTTSGNTDNLLSLPCTTCEAVSKDEKATLAAYPIFCKTFLMYTHGTTGGNTYFVYAGNCKQNAGANCFTCSFDTSEMLNPSSCTTPSDNCRTLFLAVNSATAIPRVAAATAAATAAAGDDADDPHSASTDLSLAAPLAYDGDAVPAETTVLATFYANCPWVSDTDSSISKAFLSKLMILAIGPDGNKLVVGVGHEIAAFPAGADKAKVRRVRKVNESSNDSGLFRVRLKGQSIPFYVLTTKLD